MTQDIQETRPEAKLSAHTRRGAHSAPDTKHAALAKPPAPGTKHAARSTPNLALAKPPVLRYELSVPQGAARAWPRGGRRVDRCYRRLVGRLERDARGALRRRAVRLYRAAAGQGSPFTPAVVELSYTVTLLSDGVLSLYRDYTEEADAGAGAVWRAAETWNLWAGCPVTLPGLLGRRRRAYAGLLAAAETLLAAQRRAGAPLYGDVSARARRFFRAERFYLTPDGIAIFWNPGLLAPRCAGVCSVRVPYEDLGIARPVFCEPACHPLRGTLPRLPWMARPGRTP